MIIEFCLQLENMKPMKRKFLATLVAGLLGGSMAANATPILTSLGGDSYQVSFDALSFNVNTTGEFASIVFENFYASVQPSCGTYQSGTVESSLNGGGIVALTGNSCAGAYDFLNDVDGDDLLVTVFSSALSTYGTVTAGDTLVLSSLDYTFSLPGLSIAANTGPFEAFLVNNNFQRISDIVLTETTAPVPEPATVALVGLGLFGLGYSQRRKSSSH